MLFLNKVLYNSMHLEFRERMSEHPKDLQDIVIINIISIKVTTFMNMIYVVHLFILMQHF